MARHSGKKHREEETESEMASPMFGGRGHKGGRKRKRGGRRKGGRY